MTIADIPAVVALEQAAYPHSPPKRNYSHELAQNPLAHYFVIDSNDRLTGVGGFWLIDTEAHIITLATHPGYRRRSLGEWLLLALMQQARQLGADVATLEVRPSNAPALALYHKYYFQEVGRRRRYYPDTGEDALVLTTPAFTTPHYWPFLEQCLAQIEIDKISQPD